MPSPLHLDHIIILIPHTTLLSPPSWLTQNFTLTPGGRHNDNKTENKLICFLDGSYIELISFIDDDPKKRENHWWGEKDYGIIDFAFTSSSSASENFEELTERLVKKEVKEGDRKVAYQPPIPGGRIRPDGKEIKWNVTFPITQKETETGY